MLGINYKKIHSNSVGNKTDYEMYSMDFEEFLWAKGYTQEHIDDILRHMTEIKPFNETELNVLISKIKINDKYLMLDVIGEEKLKAIYYFKNNNEKNGNRCI